MKRHGKTIGLVLGLGFVCACGTSREPEAAVSPIMQPDTGFYQEVSWRPDGTSLLVSVLDIGAGGSSFEYSIYEIQLDGSEWKALTEGPRDYWTDWSPDGSMIAFNGESGETSDIFVMRRDGTDRRPLTTDAARDAQPAWSPDGGRIVFVSDRSGSEQVWVMDADGSEQELLIEGEGEAQNPRWSPDGSEIAYYETDGAGNDSLALINADGTGRRRLGEGVWPSWTPAGDSLLYSGPDGLHLVASDGTGRRLFLAGDIVAGEISPDGSRIAVIEKRDGMIAVVVMGIDGTDRRILVQRPAPNWN